LERLNKDKGWDVGIHVDGASGAMVAPFIQEDIVWDFKLPLVRSINVSSHKYGLVYPGIGFIVWRTKECLPDEMIFSINYLGGDEKTCGINFSRNACGIIGQYYNFLRLGYQGYRAIMGNLMTVTAYIGKQLTSIAESSGSQLFDSQNQGPVFAQVNTHPGVPVLALRLTNEKGRDYTVFDVSKRLREHSWIVPAYTLAPKADKIAVLRIVVREGLSLDMAEKLVEDIRSVIVDLETDRKADRRAHDAHPPC
jgi:glutamate decarboxylase